MNIPVMQSQVEAARALASKVSLITGSTSGIGLGIARSLAHAGSAIVLNGFGKSEDIAEIKATIADEFGVNVTFSSADMSKPEAIATMIDGAQRNTVVSISSSTTLVSSLSRQCRNFRSKNGTRYWQLICRPLFTPLVSHCPE